MQKVKAQMALTIKQVMTKRQHLNNKMNKSQLQWRLQSQPQWRLCFKKTNPVSQPLLHYKRSARVMLMTPNALRHQRSSANPDLLRSLARSMDMDAAETTRCKRFLDEANVRTLSRRTLHKQIKHVQAKLRSTKQAIVDAEAVLEARHTVKSFTIEDLWGN